MQFRPTKHPHGRRELCVSRRQSAQRRTRSCFALLPDSAERADLLRITISFVNYAGKGYQPRPCAQTEDMKMTSITTRITLLAGNRNRRVDRTRRIFGIIRCRADEHGGCHCRIGSQGGNGLGARVLTCPVVWTSECFTHFRL